MPSDLLGIHLPRFRGAKTESIAKATRPFQTALRTFSKGDYLDSLSDRKDLASLVLQGVKQSYYMTLDNNLKRCPAVRVNIMVPTRNSRKPRIKILFVDDIQAFRQHELNAEWGPNDGKAGAAWKRKVQQIYAHDSTTPRYRRQRMRGPKRKKLARLNSVISTPMLSPSGKQFLGVLNLDSQCEGSMTEFTKPKIYHHISYLAKEIIPLLQA